MKQEQLVNVNMTEVSLESKSGRDIYESLLEAMMYACKNDVDVTFRHNRKTIHIGGQERKQLTDVLDSIIGINNAIL